MLTVEHADPNLAALERDASLDAGYEPGIGKKYRWIMQIVRQSVTRKNQLHQFNGLRLKKLERGDDWSMRINDKFRLIVRFAGEEPNEIITIVAIEDYH